MNFIYLEYKPEFELIEILNGNDHILSIIYIKHSLEESLHQSKLFYDEFDVNSYRYYNYEYFDPNYIKIHGKDYIEIPYDSSDDCVLVFRKEHNEYLCPGPFKPRKSFYNEDLDADIICTS